MAAPRGGDAFAPPLGACGLARLSHAPSSDCTAWPIERDELWASQLDASLRGELEALAAAWLRPWQAIGVSAEDLVPRLGEGKSDCSKETPSRICPLVMVRGGGILLHIPPRSRMFRQPLTTCHHDGLQGSSMRRLQVALRILRLTLRSSPLPDFDLRLCVDDFCHGMHERKAVPWLASVSCLTHPSIPLVQWNTQSGRDPDWAVWDDVASAREAQAILTVSNWSRREAKAIWRGAVSELYVTNALWSTQRKLKRQRISSSKWRRQGRLALLGQWCEHTDLLDVRLGGVQGSGAHVPPIREATYAQCIRELKAITSSAPSYLPIAEQAARFRYIVHVEGVAGWADRLRHLLLSGALVLKQDLGVKEWFEPLLTPFVHYVPVSSNLHNLSLAVAWARENDAAARRIALAGARRIAQICSTRAMAYYQMQVFQRYAHLYRSPSGRNDTHDLEEWPLPAKKGRMSFPNISSTARYHCEVVEKDAPPPPRRSCNISVPRSPMRHDRTAMCGPLLACELISLRTNYSRCAMIGIAKEGGSAGSALLSSIPNGC
ncbi:hypothetical protein AB1Y20_021953 [Prymnesium parvum]|uniref:Glycosyl transferase CAP10 domain-containing protein n=1 Tax=Prymnesium parvum TaxID=97485 RepID=A0AB34JER8_PRYPA